MKRILQGTLVAAAMFSFAGLRAQTADEIVNKYLDAIGGKDKLGQVKSLHTEGTVQVMGNDNPSTTTILNGKGFRSESEFNGSKFIQVFTDKSGWTVNPMAGGNAEAMNDEQYKAGRNQIYVGGQLYDYAARGNTLELQGKDGNNYKVKVTSADKTSATYYIDANTFLINKVVRTGEMQGQAVEITISLSNYQKTDAGILYPFTTEMDFGGNFSMTLSVKKIEFNQEVNPSIFDMPK